MTRRCASPTPRTSGGAPWLPRTGPLRWFVLNVEANVEVDFTALEALDAVRVEITGQGAVFALARVKQDLLARLQAFGLADKIGTGLLFPTLPTAVQAFQARGGRKGRKAREPATNAHDPGCRRRPKVEGAGRTAWTARWTPATWPEVMNEADHDGQAHRRCASHAGRICGCVFRFPAALAHDLGRDHAESGDRSPATN